MPVISLYLNMSGKYWGLACRKKMAVFEANFNILYTSVLGWCLRFPIFVKNIVGFVIACGLLCIEIYFIYWCDAINHGVLPY